MPTDRARVVVVGAGAFGGWTALHLARRGARVTLLDAWGPGHTRASSGGETRLIRATYGSRRVYTAMALRALALWREHDRDAAHPVLHETGVLWLFDGDDSFGRVSAEALRECGASLDELSRDEAARRYPQMDLTGVSSIFFEPEAGYLLARRGCERVVEQVVASGGTYRQAAIPAPIDIAASPPKSIRLQDGGRVEADVFVFACGPWLPSLFPKTIGSRIVATRQEVYYFGAPAGVDLFSVRRMPPWIDFGARQIYGVPVQGGSGFKVADDASGEEIDPTSADRDASPTGVEAARVFLARRFPALANAPLTSAEVCQYESTPDAHFIIDRHPAAGNVWIVGGGSGHGYKMGPAVGEMVASLALGESAPDPQFSLARFEQPPAGGWEEKWI